MRTAPDTPTGTQTIHENKGFFDDSDIVRTESGTVDALFDCIPPDLARLVELWAGLPDTLKGDIIALAESSADLSELPRHKTT